jgi:hypothetical protein
MCIAASGDQGVPTLICDGSAWADISPLENF